MMESAKSLHEIIVPTKYSMIPIRIMEQSNAGYGKSLSNIFEQDTRIFHFLGVRLQLA